MEGSRTFFDYLLEEDNFKLCFMLAKATSGMKTVPLDNLRLLFEMSPVVDGDFCLLDTRSLSALIALSLALVESGFQNKESITRYLLELLSSVKRAAWDCPFGVSSRRSICFPEFFGVVMGTVLTDIAAFCDEYKNEIVDKVFEEFNYAYAHCSQVNSLAENQYQHFVEFYIPFIIGLLRTFARKSSMNIPVISLIFNERTIEKKVKDEPKRTEQRESVIPKRTCNSINNERKSITGYETRFSLVMKSKETTAAVRSSDSTNTDTEKAKSGYELIEFDPVNLLHHYGLCYPLLKLKKYSANQLLKLTKQDLIFCRNVISNLLNEQFLQKLDDGCEHLYYKLEKKFHYKSYSEIISLSAISLVKSLIYNSKYIADEEVKTAYHDLLKVQYVLLNNIDVERKYLNAKLVFNPDIFNPYYLFSRASAETTEVLVKLAEEESAEIILEKLQSRISKTGPNFTRCFVFELPMYECALNCMGAQAEKYPASQFAKSAVDHLKNFLLDPSTVLSSIYGLSMSSTLPTLLDNDASKKCSLSHPLSAFARLRDCAIANLCRALQAVNISNKTEIDAALATISAKCYLTADSRTRGIAGSGRGMIVENEIVSRNCILILGHLALAQRQSFAANADLMSKVLGIFQQMFSRDSTYMDDLIVDQMGYMVMVGPAGGPLWALAQNEQLHSSSLHYYSTNTVNYSLWWEDEGDLGSGGGSKPAEYDCIFVDPADNQVYQQIMKIFSRALCGSSTVGVTSEQKISSGSGGPQFAFHLRTASSLGKSLEASSVAISHVIPTVIRTMTAMSASIRDHEHMVDFLLRLLTMFNTLGLSSVQETAVAAAKSETGGPNVQSKCNSGELLTPIAMLLERIPQEFESQKKVYKAFQQFWFFVSRLQLDDESKSASNSPKWFEAITKIARKSPLLVLSEESQNLMQIVDVDFKFMDDYSINEMGLLKSQLIARTKAKDEFANALQKIETSSQINFAYAAITLESLRHKHASIPSFRVIFQYFEELQLMKEGKINNMWTVTKGICDYVFTIYLDTMRCQSRNMAHESLLKEHSQFLLIKFNDPAHVIRKQADHYLSQLLTEFPNILWNYYFIKTSLEILDLQSMNLQQRQEGIALKTPVSGTGLELVHTRTTEERQAMLSDFTKRTKSFIQEAVKSAGNTTKSHLMHYIHTKDEGVCSTSFHPGWRLAMDFLVNDNQADPATGSCQERGNIVSFMSHRSKCLGMIVSLREMERPPNELQHKYARELMQKDSTDEVFFNAVFRLGALIIASENTSETRFMLKTVCCGFLNHFTEQGVNNSIACWEWILSARSDLTLQLFMYICEAWHSSQDRKLGIFSQENNTKNPSVFSQDAETASNLDFVVPHSLLIQFLEQKFATFKFSDHDVVDMIYHLIGQTLHSESLVKDPNLKLEFKPIMNRSLGAIGVRFRILVLAIHLLQFKFPKDDNLESELHARNTYQKRILNCAFEFFTEPSLPPVQSRDNLREDISALIDFFVLLRSERMRVVRLVDRAKKMRGSKKEELKNLASKLNLLNLLIWTEIERLTIWFSPLKLPDEPKFKQLPKLSAFVNSSLAQTNSEKFWTEYTFVAWCVSPDLAINLPTRFKYHHAIVKELRKLVRNYPHYVTHIPQAVDYLCSDMEDADSAEVMPVLTWKYGTPCAALKLLFSTRSSYTAQYAIRMLQSYPEDVLIFFVPQIVQSLRYDDVLGYVKEFILWAAKKYEILAHQFIWNMETNAYRDEEKEQKDEKIGELCLKLVEQIKKNFTPEQSDMYRKEFDFFAEVTSISGKIRPFEKGPKRKAECQRLLKSIEVGGERKGCYLPTDPNAEVVAIDYTSGIPMQSAAKAPFLAKFYVQKKQKPATTLTAAGNKERESSASSVVDTYGASSSSSSGRNRNTYVQGCIFKVGDDCRQDMLCLQLIQLFQNIFKSIGLDLYLFPYKVVSTAPGCGVIECVPDSRTRDELGKTAEQSLNVYFINMFGDINSSEYQEARRNFVISMAAYSVVGYILQIKDRHNGNIMIDKYGHVIHIDFGFLFESSPGNNLNWEPDFKLTAEFVDLMCAGHNTRTAGGAQGSATNFKITEPPFYRLFRELTVKGFLALRPYHEEIITMVTLMLETGLPCFRGQTIPKLRERLKINLSEKEARDHMLKVINDNSKNIWSKTYDMIQALQNDIAYF